MSAIINSIIARKAGLPSHHYERTASQTTKGHRHDQPGLRGHSVGDTYPYGVTGYGKRWAVTKHGAPLLIQCINVDGEVISEYRALYSSITRASAAASVMKNRGAVRTVSWSDFAEFY